MADKTVSLEIKIDATGAARSVGDLKKDIVDLKNQALKAGEDSIIGKRFLKQAGEAKDRLADLNRQVDNFQDAGAKFGAVTKLVGGLAAGFQAAQGAAALFGSAGEDIQKVMVKVQSATALAQGVQGIAGLGESFKDVGAIIKGPLVGAFTTLRGALIATGIGALAVAVGLLYENFDSVKKVLANIIPESVQKAFGYLKDAIGGAVDKVKEWVGLGEQAKGTGNLFRDAINGLKKPLEDSSKSYDAFIQKNKEHYEFLKKLSESGVPGSIGYYNFLLSESNSRLDKLVIGTDAYNKELQKNIELQQQQALLEEQKKILQGTPEELTQKIDNTELELAPVKKIEAMKTKIVLDASGVRDTIAKKESDNRKAYLNATLQSAQGALNGIAAIGNLFIKNADKQAKFQKKVAVAQLLVDTASGISSVVRDASKAGFPAAIPIIAGGIAMVLGNIAKAKAILSKAGDVSVPSLDAGGSSGGVAVPGAPTLNQQTTDLTGAQNQTQPQQNQVYVTETDIKRVGTRVNVIEARARFG